MERLYVENFGPLKKIDLKLREIIVLIGPQSSGKSTVAKLISIFRNYNFVAQEKNFNDFLIAHNIQTYFSKETRIQYESKNYFFEFNNSKYQMSYTNDNFLALLREDEEYDSKKPEYENDLDDKIAKIDSLFVELNSITDLNKINETQKEINNLTKQVENHLHQLRRRFDNLTKISTFSKYSIYIPSERSLFSVLSKSIFSFLNENISIPEVIKNFGALVERSLSENKEININFLNIKYISESNEHLVIDLKTQKKILLSESSSGFQTIIPLVIAINGFNEINSTSLTFVVEEPELNLFPNSQYELIKYIIEKCINRNLKKIVSNDLIITTHSPYCLAALNNCLIAHIEGNIKDSTISVSKVLPKKHWIDPDKFIAYELKNGKAKSITDKSSKLIDENYLDEASELINADFNSIFEIRKERVNEK